MGLDLGEPSGSEHNRRMAARRPGLHKDTDRGHVATANILLGARVDLSLTFSRRYTALQRAKWAEHTEVAMLLAHC